MIIDTHAHLDDEKYNNDIQNVLQRAKEQKVNRFIIPGANPKSLERAVKLSEMDDRIYFAVGVHPYDATNYNREYLERFITHPKCVAVGECGLDYYRLPKNIEEINSEEKLQKEVFLNQIELAKKYELPLIVHIRDSSADCLEILQKYTGDKGGVLHCYNADEALLKLLSKNFYYGIGGVDSANIEQYYNSILALKEVAEEKLLTIAGWSTGADCTADTTNSAGCDGKVSYWSSNAGRERMVFDMLKANNQNPNDIFDYVAVMSYDGGLNRFDPITLFKNYQEIYGGAIALGFEIPTEVLWLPSVAFAGMTYFILSPFTIKY